MCGIVGMYGFVDKLLLRKMMRSISHRGPDQHNTFDDKDVALGHQRLSINDLSEKGRQPMSNEDGSIQIVFNGEIYNFHPLREELRKRGHKFSSGTDTEVIIHAYEEYGPECVHRFNGCFAFALWNSKKKQLFLARDRVGIKPLYYHYAGGRLLFASEMKALLEYHFIKHIINRDALNYFLTFSCNPLHETMIQGIKKLPPGHYLTCSIRGLEVSQYWSYHKKEVGWSIDKAVSAVQSTMDDAVKLRMIADVPVGAYLSGGIDSGSVVSLMAQHTDKVRTFSVGFDIPEYADELKAARDISEAFSTDHQEIIIHPDITNDLARIVWHADEPHADPTNIPTYYLSKEAKKKVTVVLTGEGADELFGGYEQEKFMLLHQRIVRKVPLWMRKASSGLVSKIPSSVYGSLFSYMNTLGEKGKERLVEFISADEYADQYTAMMAIFSRQERVEVIGQTPGVTNEEPETMLKNGFFHATTKKTLLQDLLRVENTVLLQELLLMKVDKMTMANAIEARVPFLDHRLVELAASMPDKLKIQGMHDKIVLRHAMKKKIPELTRKRKKHRFFVPTDVWLRGELKDLTAQLLDEPVLKEQGLFRHSYIDEAFRKYEQSPLYYSRQLWTLLNFQVWHKLFMEGPSYTSSSNFSKVL